MTIEDFIKDSSAIEALSDTGNRLIMVMGGSDTGKTTLIEVLSNFLSAKTKVGIVDLDMGQSHIGPPTAIAWGKVTGGFRDWNDIVVEDFYFTGTVTPFGSLVPSVVGAKLMTDRALSSVRKVIVDTTGLIAEPAGRVLKQNKIDIISPDIVLALERSEELGHILNAFTFNKIPRIFRLSVPLQIKTKSVAKRTEYRFRRIKDYFAHSEVIEVPIAEVGIRFTKEPLHFTLSGLRNRMVSFRDKGNRDLALGFITGIKSKENYFLIRTPADKAGKFSSVVIGKAEIDMTNSVLKDVS